ncbi:MAG: Zn2+/Cd2+-exporting ATPase [Thermoproteota archaeon]|nr:Zn2+/Cd2+-exporting ATPase [Thermoproteota archaeon]
MAYDNEKKMEEFKEERKEKWILLTAIMGLTIAIAGLLDLLAQGIPLDFIIPIFNEPASISRVLYHISVIVVGAYVGFIGLREFFTEKRFSVEFLMAIAALGAVYLDFLFEGATVLFLYSLSEYFEDYIEDRARKTVEKLSQFMPEEARVVVNSSEKIIDVKEVQPGMLLLVRPGERIALDGTVVEGASSVDQSLVTGESIPVQIKTSDNVYAGTLNLSGVLKVDVTKSTENTLVSRIVKLVVESRKRKASIEKLVDRFARFYVPVIISLSVFTAVFVPAIIGGSFNVWLYRSLILLVISCPSAFVISVPATIFTAVTLAARKGVIIKGGVYVEKMAQVKAIIFDKTGTLTLGMPVVHDIQSVEELDPKILTYAAALEQFSNHPTAQAIVRKASEQGLAFKELEVKDLEEISGIGIVGLVNGLEVVVGNMEMMQKYGCNCNKIIGFYESDEHTAICISVNKIGEASVCLIDAVRGDSMEAVKALKRTGINTAMLTGDKREIAEEIAKGLGIEEVYTQLLPEDKVRIAGQMKEKYGLVAMVGDGVNDAPALAASDVGIAMGGSGVDVALESADVVLVRDELIQLPYLVKLSRETVGIARQNIVAALAIKIVLGALGLMGLVPLWFTVAAGDDGLTMLVLLNTLRLTRIKL